MAQSWAPIRAGDVDGDGHADLIVKGANAMVTALLGDGQGSVASAEYYGGVAQPMVTADLDGDGRIDAAGYLSGTIGIQHGQAGGTFSAPALFPSGGNFDSLAVGDLDQDGHSDLVVSSVDLNTLHVLLGDGSGGVLSPVAVPAGPHPYTPAIGDVTADGVPDIVVAEGMWFTGQFFAPGAQVRVLAGTGGGTFLAPVSYAVPFGVWWPVIGDVDEDGLNDVLAGTNSGLVLLLGQANGTLAPAETVSSPNISATNRPTLIDFDGDRHLDFVDSYPAGLTSHVRVLLGNGLGAFPGQVTSPSLNASGEVAVADFDGDAELDVVLTATYGFAILRPDGKGGFEPPRYHAAGNEAGYLAAADVDADGRLDLLGVAPSLVVSRNVGPSPTTGVYCTAKVNTNGCEPSIGWSGIPSASQASGFTVTATDLVNQKLGLLLYSLNGSAATPFAGGTRCLAPPPRRTVISNTGGSLPPASDCTGTLAIDLNAFAAGVIGGNPDPALSIPGTHVHCQAWARDKVPSNVQFSNGLQYFVQP